MVKFSKIPPLRTCSNRGGVFVFRVLCIADPLDGSGGPYNLKKDSSHLLMLELSRRGRQVYFSTPSSLVLGPHGVMVRTSEVKVLESAPYFSFQREEVIPAEKFSLILMRKDPPVDTAYLYATQILSQVVKKVVVINSPQTLRDWNEKLAIFNFPKWIPPTIVTANKNEISRFVRSVGGEAVLKPLGGFAGQGVARISSESLSLVGEATRDGTFPVMVQAYLPQVSAGEKRVFMIDGRPMGALLKIPPQGGFLTSPDLGGHLAPAKLSAREQRLCKAIGPVLKKNGIFFAGIDLIDGFLTEINITSPGLLWEWNEIDNRRHEKEIVDLLERKVRK